MWISRCIQPDQNRHLSVQLSLKLVASQNPSRRSKKEPPLGETGQETLYLRFLSEKQVRVNVKLRDGENVSGWIEYFDDTMIRLTREGQPNLFIYKNQIRTISERGRRVSGMESPAS
jgi:host factor-I protein